MKGTDRASPSLLWYRWTRCRGRGMSRCDRASLAASSLSCGSSTALRLPRNFCFSGCSIRVYENPNSRGQLRQHVGKMHLLSQILPGARCQMKGACTADIGRQRAVGNCIDEWFAEREFVEREVPTARKQCLQAVQWCEQWVCRGRSTTCRTRSW